MKLYSVYAPKGETDPAIAADRAFFVREGFSWPALWFGPLWLLARGLWFALAAWIVGAALVAFAAKEGRLDASTGFWLYLLSALFLGLEGQRLRAGAAQRRGLSLTGVVGGGDQFEAERNFFS